MTVAILLEDAEQIGPDLRWPLRIAALRRQETVLLLPGAEMEELDLSSPVGMPEGQRDLVRALVGRLDDYFGEGRWCPASAAEDDAPAPREENGPLVVRLKRVPQGAAVEQFLGAVQDDDDDTLVFLTRGERGRVEDWVETSRGLLAGITCELVFVVPGTREADGQLLVAASRGPHGRAAIRLAADLADSLERPLAGLYVEPDIGPEARGVGGRILDQRLRAALEDRAPAVARQVEVADRPEAGILKACEDERCEAVVVGASQLGALGAQPRGTGYKVHKATDAPTIVFVRGRLPLTRRVRRWLDLQLSRRVPQLGREERIDLVERVQSNSKWNFDFVMLTALSTLIAALGLLDDSPAVIIGAMLVAPLMTPLLGVGLALSQGNPVLAVMSLKATGLGFLTAFLLALLVGLTSPGFHQATAEMAARDWPQVLDLVVAFVSGLAAAYASGRPGLLAALPGVAIAAALLPPIATSGLAAAIGDVDLTLGSLLLFAVNMVAIVLAAAASLWAVGLRRLRMPTLVTRVLGRGLVGVAIALTIALALAPPRLGPSPALVDAVEASLGDELRLRDLSLRNEREGLVVQIDVGGGEAPPPDLGDALLEVVRESLGDEEVGVRLTYRYEVLTR